MSKSRSWIAGTALGFCVTACGSATSNPAESKDLPDSSKGATTAASGGTATTGAGGGSRASVGGSTKTAATGGTTGIGTVGGTGGAANATASGNPTSTTGTTTTENSGGAPTSHTQRETTNTIGGRGSDNLGGDGGDSGGAADGSAVGATGGRTTGGPVTAGGGASTAAHEEPEVITSGPNSYWKTEGQVTQLTSGTADVTVNEDTKYQRWDGFGGTFNEMGWDALSVVSSEIANALRLLFDPRDGANLVYGRIPLGASDYAMSWYTLDDAPGDYSMDKFTIARDRENLIPYIQAALQIKSDLRLWASPWVVPSWMMDGSKNMKSDAQTLGAHALYLARFVEEYAKEGLEIEAIHPQNEPGYARVHWTQSVFINFIKGYLGPTFAQRGLSTEIWCGTMSKDPDDTNIAKATANDAEAMKYVKGFGVQWNLEAAVATLAQKGPVMQTEHRCGNYNFTAQYWDQSRYSSTKPQNDHLYGEESWQLIRDWIVAGVNSYSAWNMVLDTNGRSLDGWPQNALLVVDRAAKKLIVTPAYYVFRHYSRYVSPGATRIGISGSNDAVAFKNPDTSIVTEVYNKGDASKTMTIKVGAALYQFDVPGHGWATLRVTP